MADLSAASLTRMRGLARSSLSLWLCSVSLRSLSSDMDCLCGREFMVDGGMGGQTLFGLGIGWISIEFILFRGGRLMCGYARWVTLMSSYAMMGG